MAPPGVQTDLMDLNNPYAIPLTQFIEVTMKVLGTDADEASAA
ncbi:hypothetical protein [Paenibacillus prosopidis]|nr:hypothetical protein [Paenibacillus prosopidis]